jgi:Flp pilus assembly protein TadD
MPQRILLSAVIIAMTVSLILIMTHRDGQRPEDRGAENATDISGSVTFVGRPACVRCHEPEDRLWQGSHHDLAMEVADKTAVLGDFNDVSFSYFGVTSRFFTRDEKFLVRTDGPDGKLRDYPIAYVLGAVPLQQYLIELHGGRYQALGIAWDTRPQERGGQRWFHLYPEERIGHDDPLHWTRPSQNWNFMCAECHSTDLQKNYDLARDAYQTTWFEIDVSCEACHGPCSKHVWWAEAVERGDARKDDPEKGLVVDLKDRDNAVWVFDPGSGIAGRSKPRRSRTEIETCARCHSRRAPVVDEYVFGRPLMDTHRPLLLDGISYHIDGQIKEEVYVYGSFLQSKMYRAGVTCKDCHEPHSLRLQANGNDLCARCHLPSRFNTISHHFHEPESPGADCVTCHMPEKIYMIVDARHDHSLRNPRPDLSIRLGTPNTCSACHTDQSTQWAVDAVIKWYGPERPTQPHFGEALHAGQRGLPGGENALVTLVENPMAPAIARASAVRLLPRYASRASFRSVVGGLEAKDPLIRWAAASSMEGLEHRARLRLTASLLRDPVRTVRLEAARILAAVPIELMTSEQRVALEQALAEYRHAEQVNADRPESHLNLGVLHVERGELAEAAASYKTALEIAPSFTRAYVNLADLYRIQGRDEEGERTLRRALTIAPNDADVNHALGLLLVRQRRTAEALEVLGKAARLSPEVPRYGYVFGVALRDAGETDRAVTVLKRTHDRHPGERDVLVALATMSRETGATETAIGYARELVRLTPEDPGAHRLLETLQSERR